MITVDITPPFLWLKKLTSLLHCSSVFILILIVRRKLVTSCAPDIPLVRSLIVCSSSTLIRKYCSHVWDGPHMVFILFWLCSAKGYPDDRCLLPNVRSAFISPPPRTRLYSLVCRHYFDFRSLLWHLVLTKLPSCRCSSIQLSPLNFYSRASQLSFFQSSFSPGFPWHATPLLDLAICARQEVNMQQPSSGFISKLHWTWCIVDDVEREDERISLSGDLHASVSLSS